MGRPEGTIRVGEKGFEELKAVFISFAEDLAKLVVRNGEVRSSLSRSRLV